MMITRYRTLSMYYGIAIIGILELDLNCLRDLVPESELELNCLCRNWN